MYLTIDLGNTAAKVIVYENNAVRLKKKFSRLSRLDLIPLYNRFPIQGSILSSVVQTPVSLLNFLKRQRNFLQVAATLKFPFKIQYKTPESLGNDRLAAVAGAYAMFPSENVLVIDAGTCIKFDFISRAKEYKGGSISPGMEMRFKSLPQFTDRLPLVRPSNVVELNGRSTRDSILSGVMLGIRLEMEGRIQQYQKKYKNLKIVMTGGDAPRFAGQLNLPIFAAPDLVNSGLNEILNFNLANE